MSKELDYWIRDGEDGNGSVLIPRSPWTNAFAEILHSQNISSLRLSYSAGFRGDSIAFVEALPFLRSHSDNFPNFVACQLPREGSSL